MLIISILVIWIPLQFEKTTYKIYRIIHNRDLKQLDRGFRGDYHVNNVIHNTIQMFTQPIYAFTKKNDNLIF